MFEKRKEDKIKVGGSRGGMTRDSGRQLREGKRRAERGGRVRRAGGGADRFRKQIVSRTKSLSMAGKASI